MFSSSGGGFSAPNIDSPLELLIVLLVFAFLIWLAFRFFSN